MQGMPVLKAQLAPFTVIQTIRQLHSANIKATIGNIENDLRRSFFEVLATDKWIVPRHLHHCWSGALVIMLLDEDGSFHFTLPHLIKNNLASVRVALYEGPVPWWATLEILIKMASLFKLATNPATIVSASDLLASLHKSLHFINYNLETLLSALQTAADKGDS